MPRVLHLLVESRRPDLKWKTGKDSLEIVGVPTAGHLQTAVQSLRSRGVEEVFYFTTAPNLHRDLREEIDHRIIPSGGVKGLLDLLRDRGFLSAVDLSPLLEVGLEEARYEEQFSQYL